MNGETDHSSQVRTSWVWEITDWSSRPQEDYQSFKRNLWNISQIHKEIHKITTCSLLDLETLGFWPISPTNLPEHWHDLVQKAVLSNLITTQIMQCAYFFIPGARLTYECLTHPESTPAQVFAWLFGDQLRPTDQALVQGLIEEYALCVRIRGNTCYCLKCGHKACLSSAERGWRSVRGDFWA